MKAFVSRLPQYRNEQGDLQLGAVVMSVDVDGTVSSFIMGEGLETYTFAEMLATAFNAFHKDPSEDGARG